MNRGTIIRKKQIKYIDENDYNRIFVISDLQKWGLWWSNLFDFHHFDESFLLLTQW